MSEETNQNNAEEGRKICPLIKADCLQNKCEWFVAAFVDMGGTKLPTGRACAVSLLSRITA